MAALDRWGPRLPVDPPLDYDGRPVALAAWIHCVGNNANLRTIDEMHVRLYCGTAESIAGLEHAMREVDPGSGLYTDLLQEIATERKFLAELEAEMWPG